MRFEKIIFILVVVLLSINIIFFPYAKAQATNEPTDAREVIAREFNIPLDKIPTDKKELERFALKEEWTRMIANNSVTGPVHKFLSNSKTQIAFKALFAHEYEISLMFFLILILWCFVWVRAAKILESAKGSLPFFFEIKGWTAVAMGALIAVILAQVQFFNFVITNTLNLIFKPENWWIRAILIIVALGVFMVVYVLSRLLDQYFKKREKAKKETELNQEVEKTREFNKGVQATRNIQTYGTRYG